MLLFCRATPQNLRVILDTFEFYGSLSGQNVNWEKFSIYFGRDILEGKITDFLSASSIKRGSDSMTYLGISLFIEGLRHYWLVPWVDMIKSKLESWRDFTLSMADRLSLITLIIQGSFLHSF